MMIMFDTPICHVRSYQPNPLSITSHVCEVFDLPVYIQVSHEQNPLLSMKYWLFNTAPWELGNSSSTQKKCLYLVDSRKLTCFLKIDGWFRCISY